MRLLYINGTWWVVSEPQLVTRYFSAPVNGKESVEHMASSIERPATAEEVREWKQQ